MEMAWWEVLGLEPDADTRSIKRRYAQLLKSHRPDEDPEGFQRLHEAYEAGLHNLERPCRPLFSEPVTSEASAGSRPEREPARVHQGEREASSGPAAASGHAAPVLLGLSTGGLDRLLSEAEYRQQRPAFEQAVLAQCLAAGSEGQALVDWALLRLGWFAAGDTLSPQALDRLALRLAERTLEELCACLGERGSKVLLERLDAALRQPWLQGLDRRDDFQRRLFSRVLALPAGAALFAPLCKRFGWSKVDFPGGAAAFEELAQQASEAALAAKLQRSLARKKDRKPAQKAARLLLTPMSEAEQLRATGQFGRKEWKACKRLADKLERYPRVWAFHGSPDLEAWQTLVPPQEGWRHLTLALWLLAVGVLLLMGGRDWTGDGLDMLVELAFVAVEALLAAVVVRILMTLGSVLLRPLEAVDLQLSRRLLGRARKGRQGLRILRHGLGSALLAGAAAMVSGLPGGQAGALGLGIFVVSLVFAGIASGTSQRPDGSRTNV